MTISRDATFDLLSRWKNEPAIVRCIWTFGDSGGVIFAGFIEELVSSGFSIINAGPDFNSTLNFRLDQATEFDYKDIREAPDTLRSQIGTSVSAFLSIKTTTSLLVLWGIEQEV